MIAQRSFVIHSQVKEPVGFLLDLHKFVLDGFHQLFEGLKLYLGIQDRVADRLYDNFLVIGCPFEIIDKGVIESFAENRERHL